MNLNHQRKPLLIINLGLLMNFYLAEYILTLSKVRQMPHGSYKSLLGRKGTAAQGLLPWAAKSTTANKPFLAPAQFELEKDISTTFVQKQIPQTDKMLDGKTEWQGSANSGFIPAEVIQGTSLSWHRVYAQS